MLTLRRLSDDDLGALQADPDTLTSLLCDVDGVDGYRESLHQANMEAAIAAVGKDAWRGYADGGDHWLPMVAASMMQHLTDNAPPEVTRPEFLDLDKSWHILHTVISGSPDAGDGPAAALLGGEEFGPDSGYGPARLLRHDAVSAFADVLEPLDVESLKSRADPATLREQGVAFATGQFDADMIGFEIEDHFPPLKKFVNQTVKKRRHLLMFLN